MEKQTQRRQDHHPPGETNVRKEHSQRGEGQNDAPFAAEQPKSGSPESEGCSRREKGTADDRRRQS